MLHMILETPRKQGRYPYQQLNISAITDRVGDSMSNGFGSGQS